MACTFFLLTFGVVGRGFTQDITIKIHLRGVYESKITLLSLTGTNALKPIISVNASHGTHLLPVPVADMLPAEFILRFDYKEKETSTPYPSEKRIIISNQDLELWVNPPYCNNNDSTWFQKNEKENTVSEKFTKENGKQKEKLSLLQNFLMNYDDTQSQFYKQGIEEYEKRCGSYNQWLKEQSTLHKDLFISHTFQFCRDVACNVSFKGDALSATLSLSKCMSKGSETDRLQSVIAHYFDGIDFKDTLLLHTQQLNLFITTYVNMYASLAKTQAGLDSLYPLIGKTAIEKARLGNPKVYGWLVDYFYKGYESTNMPAGIKMLEPYINDTTCLTTKRQAIEKRLKGIKTLTIGTLAPDFIINTSSNLTGFENPLSFKTGTTFHQYKTNSRYKLLLFWSADCGHCKDLVSKLYTWYNQQHVNTPHGVYPIVDVFALSLDNTITEIPIWQNTITQLQGWKHIRCEGGINSTEANAYFILSAPVMILIDTKTNKICAIPGNTEELKHALDEISKK
ncbi:MAG TPA: alkyl hydroperoxide reductase [Bacteroidales bacterium]|nr:alkyl hydroperoxide reductase [Bacteroidales bacterium]